MNKCFVDSPFVVGDSFGSSGYPGTYDSCISLLDGVYSYFQHQAQVVAAMERAKQVTNADLAVSIITLTL